MTTVISMLRGVNVGGKRPLKMTELVELYRSIGCEEPRSYIQSGNVIFGWRAKDFEALARRIESAIEKQFGFRSGVILRTAEELDAVIERNPFHGRVDVLPKLVVTFLAVHPAPDAQTRIDALPSTLEEFHLKGRELFAYFPNGISGSKVPVSAIDRALGVTGTARNWNTVAKLAELARSL